jgi:hypothetical protein
MTIETIGYKPVTYDKFIELKNSPLDVRLKSDSAPEDEIWIEATEDSRRWLLQHGYIDEDDLTESFEINTFLFYN